MNSTKTTTVDAVELRDAFDFVSFGEQLSHTAYICLDTGKIYCHSGEIDMEEEELPDDIETSDRYISVPHKHDLNLGRRLVFAFVDQELPADADTVEGYFRRRGAYGRFKDLLDRRNMLQKWYDFEEHATEAALLAWCEDNDIQPVQAPN